MLSFSSVAEAYRPDPPSPVGVNFFLTLCLMMGEVSPETSSKNTMIQDMINSETIWIQLNRQTQTYSRKTFIYKVYINSLLKVSTDHCCAISINRLSLPSLSVADDVPLLASYPSFLETFMINNHTYGKTWRYKFNHTRSGVVTFHETKLIHSQLM